MASSSPSRGPGTPIPDSPAPTDLPLTMSASIVLTSLPKDTHNALENAGVMDLKKVSVRFKAISSAPQLSVTVYKINASQRFETVVKFLRGKLGLRKTEGLFYYVNSQFAPGLDEVVGNLWKCFRTDDQLIVTYSTTPAFG
ncbi:MAG: Ubiquitin-like protein [Vezdaea acicularis]|nr:MAG: Ubiquitin-like protein [Vezdaea acicularis]